MNLTLPNEVLLPEVAALLAHGNEVEIRTKGASMLPFIVGDRDSVRLKAFPAYEVGDAVLAEIAPGRFVLHRIVKIDGDCVTLKGDGNLVGTESCSLGDVKGKAVSVVRPGGKTVDICSPRFMARARRWNALPYFVRRYYLAIYRRLI
ncbi:MAG: S24/S26 family peptidase [Bacteroidales bacterium]|nr:S24/S26 family peptidase [Bacteroidales bacterium]